MTEYANDCTIGLVNAVFLAIPLWGAMIYGAAHAIALFGIGG